MPTYKQNFEPKDNQFPDEHVQNELVEILPACACRQWPDTDAYPQSYVAIAVVPRTPETSPAPIGHNPCRALSDDLELPHMSEPLDMRTVEEWDRREWRQQDHHIQQLGPHPVNSSFSISPRRGHQSYKTSTSGDNFISDYLLMTLSVPELHKRLRGFPRENVTNLIKKRRTLKNRGYAQDCRNKRLLKRQELELANRSLQDELHLTQLQLGRVTHERHVLNQQLAQVGRQHVMSQHTSHAPLTQHSQPEFFSEL